MFDLVRKWFGTLAALAVTAAVLIPAGLAAGSHEDQVVVGDDRSHILLKLGNQDIVTWGQLTEGITTRKNNCLAVSFTDSPNDLIDVVAIGGSLGEVKDGLGVKGSADGSGEPCGRAEAEDGEAIAVFLGSAADGYLMTAIDVDLELKFNAQVDVIFKHQGEEVTRVPDWTGTGGSDDGPDSGDGDNHRFNSNDEGIVGALFDEVVFAPQAGAISLEGGADGTDNGKLVPTSNASQFEVVKVFDGHITCGETVVVSDEGAPGVAGAVTLRSMEFDPEGEQPQDWYDADCLRKLFNEDTTPSSLLFAPELANVPGRYTLTLTIEEELITFGDDGQVTSLFMEYNDGSPNGGDRPLKACLGQPGEGDFWTEDELGIMPDGEFACYYDVSVQPTHESEGQVFGTETWSIVFVDDPGFNWK